MGDIRAATRSRLDQATPPAEHRSASSDRSAAGRVDFVHAGSLAAADAGARVRSLAALSGAAGNRALSGLLGGPPAPAAPVQRTEPGSQGATQGPGTTGETAPDGGAAPADDRRIAPRLAANPYVEETAPVTLQNARFAGIAGLDPIASGSRPLSARDNGEPVRAVQQALLDLGYALLVHERDGQFGAETEQAISQYRGDRGMGPGALTSRALGELDQEAPPPGERREHFLDYERLFADDRLDVAIAVGYTEEGITPGMLADVRAQLTARGFAPEPSPGGEPTVFSADKSVTYPTRDGDRRTRTILVRATLLGPGAGSAERFGELLNESELAVYTGHARRGIGPDFDPDISPTENFVIGVNTALAAAGRRVTAPTAADLRHYHVDEVNDVEAMTQRGAWDPERYRVWFFNACRSMAYVDELRGGLLPEEMDRSNLDLFVTRSGMPVEVGVAPGLSLLDGVLRAETMEQLVGTIERDAAQQIRSTVAGPEGERRAGRVSGIVATEGAGDNPEARPASP